ncbi:MAG: IS3 family transposase [Aeromicrobium sp.]
MTSHARKKRSRSWEKRSPSSLVGGPVEIYCYIQAEKERDPEAKISVMCRVLGVSRSGFYDWLKRLKGPLRGRAAEDAKLLAEIQTIHRKFKYYGAPRIHRELLAHRHCSGRHKVARLMRIHGIKARRGKIKSRRRTAPPKRRAEVADRVRRQFNRPAPNMLWFTDLTQIRTHQGWLYAAVILEAYNREVVSWAVAAHDTPKTAMTAFADAIKIRRPQPGCVIHSDRGYQFTSFDWLNLAADNGLEPSIGERKNPRDNAVMESWFSSLKSEEIYPNGQPVTREEARSRLFHYIWTYNHERLHSTLGYLSPLEYARINQQLSA